jgi:NAD(P) transhydrogenase subunit alpha
VPPEADSRVGDPLLRITNLRKENRGMTDVSLVIELTILVLAIFLGFEVISKVPTMLHTPLMSGTNFIHGIVIVGAIIVLGFADDTFTKTVGFVAMVLATANVVGGWFVTDRMLEMFKRRPDPKQESPPPPRGAGSGSAASG